MIADDPSRLPSITVVIPVFNDADGVRATLRGVGRQDYPMDLLEVIVVDNASDPPIAPIDGHRFRTHVVRCAKPGSYAARNVGARLATGDVLAFTDADCVPDSAWLSAGVRRLLDGRGKLFVGGEVAFFELKERSATALYQTATGFAQESNMRDKRFAATANLLCTARQFEQVGPFDERLLSGGDREWAWRATRLEFEIQYEPQAIVRTHPRYRLRSAMRQARRVAAGRMMLRELDLTHAGPAALSRQRSPWQSLTFIFTRSELTPFERLRVFGVAIVLRAVYAFEDLRLRFGTRPERR